MIDRLERAGFARRVRDERDRRKVLIEVTPAFYARADEIWGPAAADWQRMLGDRFSDAELATIVAFLTQAGELAERHAERLATG